MQGGIHLPVMAAQAGIHVLNSGFRGILIGRNIEIGNSSLLEERLCVATFRSGNEFHQRDRCHYDAGCGQPEIVIHVGSEFGDVGLRRDVLAHGVADGSDHSLGWRFSGPGLRQRLHRFVCTEATVLMHETLTQPMSRGQHRRVG